jgi:transcriptional regulator with XRE-family HTH domain
MADDFAGARIRYWRLKRGISQRTLAGLAGISQGYVSQVEAGLKEIDRRSTMVRLAEALQVSVAELTNHPGPSTPEFTAAEAAVPAIRAALNVVRLGEVIAPRRSLAELRTVVAGLVPTWKAARYDRLSPILPDLLLDLHALTSSVDEQTRRGALRLIAETMHCATSTVRHLGCGDLAMIAADVGHAAAVRLDEPVWRGVAEYVRLITLPSESKAVTQRLAVEAADRLSATTPSGEALQVAGMLHLSAAFSAATCGSEDETVVHLDEARSIAERTGEGNFATMQFGPTNVAFWETSIAVAMGEGGRVIEIAKRIDPDGINSDTRKAAYFIDKGRGLAQTRRHDAEAVACFVRAERTAPQRTRRSPVARETLGTMLRRARANAGGDTLRGLAARFGVA